MANLAGISGSSIRTEINNELLSYDECFKMDLQHYWRVSNKSVATFESTEGWANNSWNSTVGTVANDTTNYKVGSQGISITSPNNGGGGKLSKVMNLSTFNDGSASTTNDYIQFALYITTAEIAKLNTNGILLRFFCETAPTMTSYFSYNIAVANLVNGWNFLNIVKSSFATNGSAAWADVKGLSFTNNGAPISGSPIYTVDAMRMVRKDPSTSAANPFQKLVNNIWTRDFTINNGHWFVGLENNKIICRALSVNDTGVTNTASSLIGQKIYRNFEIMGVFQSNTTSLSRLVWAIDASNRVYATLVAGTLYLSSTINGVNDDTVNASLSAAIGDLFSIKLSKNGRTFTAKVVKNGNNDSPIILTKDISGFEISDGYLGFGERSGIKQSNIVSLGISKLSFTAQAGEAEESKNVTSQVGGKNITDIFESDGVTVKNATTVDNKHVDDTASNIPLYDENKTISGSATGDTRFQISGHTSANFIILPGVFNVLQTIYVNIPTGKAVYLKRCRFGLLTLGAKMRIEANMGWTSATDNVEETPNMALTNTTGNIRIQIGMNNSTGADATVQAGCGWWFDFSIE
jgi:hypothetical protein